MYVVVVIIHKSVCVYVCVFVSVVRVVHDCFLSYIFTNISNVINIINNKELYNFPFLFENIIMIIIIIVPTTAFIS